MKRRRHAATAAKRARQADCKRGKRREGRKTKAVGAILLSPWKRRLWVGVFACFLLFSLFSLHATAQNADEDTDPDTAANASHWLARLRETIPPELAGSIKLEDPDDAAALVGVPHFFALLADNLTDQAPLALGAFAAFCGLALLGALAAAMGEGLRAAPLQKGIQTMAGAALSLSVFGLMRAPLDAAVATLTDLRRFSEALLPVSVSLYAASGNYATAATHSATVGLSLSFQAQLTDGLLSPLISACLAFALLGGVADEADTDGMAASLRQIYLVVQGAMTTLFSASLALQTVIASASDSVAIRCAKYAVGQMIPGVGGVISGTLSTLASSLSLIKGAIGVGGIGIIVMILVPPLVELLLYSLALSLASGFCGLLGFPTGKKLFLRFKGICDMVLGTLCLSAVMSVLALAVFIRCGIAVG